MQMSLIFNTSLWLDFRDRPMPKHTLLTYADFLAWSQGT
jgi:hypothetical protein